jgi:REP element-mobilizing transposase RayT
MPTLQRFLLENAAYHTISVTRGRRPLLSDPRAAAVILDTIDASRSKSHLYLLAYALMPDHMHLLCVPGDGVTISDVMKAIKGTSAKAANRAGLHEGPLWKQGFYDRVIRSEEHLNATVDYIHCNPVVAGLAEVPADYPYSSTHASATTDVGRFFSR